MKHERNTEGLKDNAARKRQEAFERTDKAIQQLIKQKKKINFNTVAEAADVSKAWLYKEPQIKQRIQSLRGQSTGKNDTPPQEKTTDSSWKAKYQTLKDRLTRVEAENRGLREQLEVTYGRILSVSELEYRVEYLEKQNLQLQEELTLCKSQLPKRSSPENSSVVNFSPKKAATISDTITQALNALGIESNDTLASKIKNAEEDVVLNAIEALNEQLQHKIIPNPGGWLAKAIDGQWKPNKPLGEARSADVFAEWYGLAREQGIVIGSRKADDDSMWVQENTGQWVLFEDFSSKWTIEYLRLKSNAKL